MVLWFQGLITAKEVVVVEAELLDQLQIHQARVVQVWVVQVETVLRFLYLVLHMEEAVVVELVLTQPFLLLLWVLVVQVGKEVAGMVEMAVIIYRDL
jgi:RecB family endonuclease NucS